MREAEIRLKIQKAFEELLKKDFFLLLIDVNERTLTHRLAIYLEKYFPEYHVDCEYNRNGIGNTQKRLHGLKQRIYNSDPNNSPEDFVEDPNAKTVFPDIIIHRRGIPDGFVVIEAKKSNNPAGYDKYKLELYKKELGYKFAYFVNFPIPTRAFSDTEFITPDYDVLIKKI